MIKNFCGEFSFLSNFTESPIFENGILWPTVEHFFQAMKTLNTQEREVIRLARTPGKAKRLGRKVELRQDWETKKEDIMLAALRLKFTQKSLRHQLLETGNSVLIEGNNWHDNTWGACSCTSCCGKGQNLLGKLLMQVRDEISTQQKFVPDP